jgi:hypothetical protein
MRSWLCHLYQQNSLHFLLPWLYSSNLRICCSIGSALHLCCLSFSLCELHQHSFYLHHLPYQLHAAGNPMRKQLQLPNSVHSQHSCSYFQPELPCIPQYCGLGCARDSQCSYCPQRQLRLSYCHNASEYPVQPSIKWSHFPAIQPAKRALRLSGWNASSFYHNHDKRW